jgi:predicted metal-dependent hydrolase
VGARRHGTEEHDQVAVGGTAIPYVVRWSARRQRTLQLRLTHEGLRVAAPLSATPASVREFVARHADWIAKQRERAPAPPAPFAIETGATLPYRGGELTLDVTSAHSRATATLHGGVLRVAVPDRPGAASAARDAVIRCLRREAAEAVGTAVGHWSAAMGLQPSAVTVRDQRTRWGSCSASGVLRFNWRLIMVAPDLLDYVVVHELAHLARRDHSPAYWAIVAAVMPDHRERRRQLRDAGRMFPF